MGLYWAHRVTRHGNKLVQYKQSFGCEVPADIPRDHVLLAGRGGAGRPAVLDAAVCTRAAGL